MSNILLDENLHPYLIDFEHAVNLRAFRPDVEPETRAGTLPYMPSLRVSSMSQDVDIHAFGILLALVVNQRVWKGGEERGAKLVESLFTVQTTPNLQKPHSLLKNLCLRCVQLSSIDCNMEEVSFASNSDPKF